MRLKDIYLKKVALDMMKTVTSKMHVETLNRIVT